MKRIITALMIIVMTTLSVNAAEEKQNFLNTIQIDTLKDTYNITLNTKSSVDIKRTIQSSDNVILTLKGVKPAKTLNTIYKNASEVDNIMVEPVGDNTLNIIIKAKNVSNAAVTVEPEETELQAQNGRAVLTPKKAKKSKKQSIVLAAPIDAYMPVYNEEDDEEELEDNFAVSGILGKIKEALSQGNLSNIITTGLIGIILLCGIKLFKKEEPDTAIGLAQSLKEREISLYKDMSMRKGVEGPMSLAQQPSSFVAPKMPIAPQVAKPSVNINAGLGLSAYKSSVKSPYMSADNTMMSKRNITAQSMSMNAPQPKAMSTVGSRVSKPNMSLNINRPVQNFSTTSTTPSNVDSKRFLDAMSQIYMRSGRQDLAQGLQAGMLKSKM